VEGAEASAVEWKLGSLLRVLGARSPLARWGAAGANQLLVGHG